MWHPVSITGLSNPVMSFDIQQQDIRRDQFCEWRHTQQSF